MTKLDTRRNAYRADLADKRLSGLVDAARFVEGEPATVVVPIVGLHRAPREDAVMETQALHGERMRVFEARDGWSWVSLMSDGYVGYVASAALTPGHAEATHRVAVPLAHIYPKPNIKTQPATPLPMNARVAVLSAEGDMMQLTSGGFVHARHLKPLDWVEPDFVIVAERFLHAPYLWGGKSAGGIDCSGLVQVALAAAGIAAPRDSDLQELELGTPIDLASATRGDLVFWKGHVGILLDRETLLHANGFAMQVSHEPLGDTIARIAKGGSAVTAVKRVR